MNFIIQLIKKKPIESQTTGQKQYHYLKVLNEIKTYYRSISNDIFTKCREKKNNRLIKQENHHSEIFTILSLVNDVFLFKYRKIYCIKKYVRGFVCIEKTKCRTSFFLLQNICFHFETFWAQTFKIQFLSNVVLLHVLSQRMNFDLK